MVLFSNVLAVSCQCIYIICDPLNLEIDLGVLSRKRWYILSLQWRHNGHDRVSNHQPHDCLLNRLFRRRSKKTSKLRVTGFVRGIHRDRWIPRTKGQSRGKCFHLMTSSCCKIEWFCDVLKLYDRIMRYFRLPGNNVAKRAVKFQSSMLALTFNLAASILHGVARIKTSHRLFH